MEISTTNESNPLLSTQKRKLISSGYDKSSLPFLYSMIREGDCLEFFRENCIEHWAVYIGLIEHEGKKQHCVIHRNRPSDKDLKNPSRIKHFIRKYTPGTKFIKKDVGGIQMEPVDQVIKNDLVRINNELDKKFEPKIPKEIVGRAKALLKTQHSNTAYNLFYNNCEHFVNCCRYGQHYSRQVSSKGKTGVSKVTKTIAGLASSHVAVASIVGIAGGAMGPIFGTVFGVAAGVTVLSVLVIAIINERHRRKENKVIELEKETAV